MFYGSTDPLHVCSIPESIYSTLTAHHYLLFSPLDRYAGLDTWMNSVCSVNQRVCLLCRECKYLYIYVHKCVCDCVCVWLPGSLMPCIPVILQRSIVSVSISEALRPSRISMGADASSTAARRTVCSHPFNPRLPRLSPSHSPPVSPFSHPCTFCIAAHLSLSLRWLNALSLPSL